VIYLQLHIHTESTFEILYHKIFLPLALQIGMHTVYKYRHPSLSAVNWFQKNRALSEIALNELHRKVSVQKLKSAT
jgi:hypothetical protein